MTEVHLPNVTKLGGYNFTAISTVYLTTSEDITAFAEAVFYECENDVTVYVSTETNKTFIEEKIANYRRKDTDIKQSEYVTVKLLDE